MTTPKPSDHGIVVENKETEIRYAISDRNYDPEKVRKVRDLRPGESVTSYTPRRKGSLVGANDPNTQETAAGEQGTDPSDSQ